MLRPIDFHSLDDALPVLARGFPARSHAAWTASLQRLRQYGRSDPGRTAGYMLEAKGRDVGVLLAIPGAATGAPVVNLSSWYVDPEHRFKAPRMLQQIVGSDTTLFTDLTPTPQVRTMIGRFGFRTWTDGIVLFALPWFALKSAKHSHVLPLHEIPADAFAPAVQTLLDDHAALDCIACALWDGHSLHPLIFSRTRRRGLPLARLVYADDLALVNTHIAAISRHLLRERVIVLAVNGNRNERARGTIFTEHPSPAYFKGDRAPGPRDLAYSEYVFLQV